MADPKTERTFAEAIRRAKRERVMAAAVTYVYDRNCPTARRELDAAVVDLMGITLDGTPAVAKTE